MKSQAFQGGVFHTQLPGGRAGATIVIDADGISARVPDSAGGETFRIGFADCSLQQGGASGRMVFCRDSNRSTTIFCEEKQFLSTLAASGGDRVASALSTLNATEGGKRARTRRHWLVGLSVAAILGFAGYQAFSRAGNAAVRALPISVDEKMGELAWSAIDKHGPEVKDAVVVGAIQKMADRLAPQSKSFAGKRLAFRVTVIDAPIVNAFCLPGGRIVVFTGLIRKASDPDQVASVLGHEMAHATLRHGLQRIAQSAGIIVALQIMVGDLGGLMAFVTEIAQQGLITSYGREQETEADMEGLLMAHGAGIDGSGLERFFAVLEQEHGDVPEVLQWLSTHPQLTERRATIKQRWKELGPSKAVAWEIDWEAVVKRAGNPSLTAEYKPESAGVDSGVPRADDAPDATAP
ncbi:MAG: M48 family metallopeptidase [Deltaproteobacteria bacterium]|nr:M48 family metallopeptidase [Deltaproteobacteria bacterium]